jgi:hypothetical protein
MIRARSSSSPELRWLLTAISRRSMDCFVSCMVPSLTMTCKVVNSSQWLLPDKQIYDTNKVHRLGDKPTRHADVDRSFLPIAG